ncbi:hypothetical protein OG585_45755 [Streptomyces sp. NBC_01340]|uniref:hypothetical protein n=1 Tax=Streptomyces sp. NBC_01340 TaxID=2903830 RepID=UPI002E0D610C|nr:hypothetical protein OG585_01165 [Streptomyces sp. NBC_01340]WSI43759.1 hypothetical protein OG585_45755 [Streptomyces sp. NBC_01340]
MRSRRRLLPQQLKPPVVDLLGLPARHRLRPCQTGDRLVPLPRRQQPGQVLLWTGNRTLSTGEKLGLAQAVRYEKANGASIPSYSHIAVALRSTGQQ